MTTRHAQPAKRHRFLKHLIMTKPEVGTIVAHALPWPLRTTIAMSYIPPAYDAAWDVPEDRWDDILKAGSPLEMMAMIRSAPAE